jgi:hypothetical protein
VTSLVHSDYRKKYSLTAFGYSARNIPPLSHRVLTWLRCCNPGESGREHENFWNQFSRRGTWTRLKYTLMFSL